MDFLKLDAGLLSACEDFAEARSSAHVMEVFIHTIAPPNPEQTKVLEQFGVRNIRPGRSLFTGTISVESLDALSELPWVKALTIARRLIPAERRQAPFR